MNTDFLGKGPDPSDIPEEFSKYELARVTSQHHLIYDVQVESKSVRAQFRGQKAFNASSREEFPVVGDWVMIDPTDQDQDVYIIHALIPRKSVIKRKSPDGSNESQVIVANVDIGFICMSLNRDFNVRRLERYLTMVWDGNVTPVVVLTKADLSDDINDQLSEVEAVTPGVEILVSSIDDPNVVGRVKAMIQPNNTAVLLGSSGVGKSTLINRLFGEEIMATNEIREDGKGRHTTTSRHMFKLPEGGVIIDTPGLRELQIDAEGLAQSFSDIEELKIHCKFNDCAHQTEPGCAVHAAIDAGKLSVERWESYQKLEKEVKYGSLSAKQVESQKLNSMFGGKKQYKKKMNDVKKKNKR